MQVHGIKFIGAALALVGAGFLLGWSAQAPTTLERPRSTEAAHQVVHLMIDDDSGLLKTFPNEQFFAGQSVFDILKAAVARGHGALDYDPSTGSGVFVREILGKKNGTEKKYWQYWVNGAFAMVAADNYILHAGDTILWKFTHEQTRL